MLLDKNFLIGVGLGIAAGAVGYKLYNEHRQTILESLDNLKNRMCPGAGSEVAVTEQQTTEIDQGQQLDEAPDTSNSSGQGYTEMGKVYKDPTTGKLIMVEGG